MKTFEQLTHWERERELAYMTQNVIDSIIEGVLEIEFFHHETQKDFNKIMKDAGAMDSVRYAQKEIDRHKGIRSEIERISLIICSESLYDENGSLIKNKEKANEVPSH